MFDIGWSEMMLIGVVALVVIGPKELPAVLRTVGQGVGKLRRMAGEFQGQFREALREAELDGLREGLKKDFTSFSEDTRNAISAAIPTNPLHDLEKEMNAAAAQPASAKPVDEKAAIDQIEGRIAAPPPAEAPQGVAEPLPAAPTAPVESSALDHVPPPPSASATPQEALVADVKPAVPDPAPAGPPKRTRTRTAAAGETAKPAAKPANAPRAPRKPKAAGPSEARQIASAAADLDDDATGDLFEGQPLSASASAAPSSEVAPPARKAPARAPRAKVARPPGEAATDTPARAPRPRKAATRTTDTAAPKAPGDEGASS
ncbi:Sec-independent protein translocase protein TatB [Ancylobacter sp. 6x-1]|uniref:Sec-independent protein translocase protein TatB n=1 Tax=Ancylobacter crimeensis TaxID=2579147 RepID=A0ABT0DG55_9HYPH|nr:Sec-independent protein translocase protein TatB [Ancylobacter crimeensis]MCK0198849.1 Sec-independent protein translocase protein TatB [Ancylobacter crimeensis]